MAASCIGPAASSQRTTRPSFSRVTSPASSSTRRCFMKPGSDIPCGCASSVTVAPPCPSCRSTSRRVASDNAPNTWSRTAESASAEGAIGYDERPMGSGCSMPTRLLSVS